MADVLQAPATMPRAVRRQIARLHDEIERVTQTDAAFFTRHPDRSHRLRLLSVPERKNMALMNGETDMKPPAGDEWIVAVRQVAPGRRLRVFLTVDKGSDLDQPEHVCRSVYETKTGHSGRARDLEAALRTITEGGNA